MMAKEEVKKKMQQKKKSKIVMAFSFSKATDSLFVLKAFILGGLFDGMN